MATKKYIVTGATGKQGGAVIKSLLDLSTTSSGPISIFALTRNPGSGKGQSLASNPSITVVKGDTSAPKEIFSQTGPVDGAFLVTVPGKAGDEEAQAIPFIDESIAQGVKHIVFSSVDRGGAGVSEQTPTDIPHFASKHRIEQHLRDETSTGTTKWTILRPVAFMDNLTPDFMGKGFASMWAGVGDKPLQLVATKDIGNLAALALLNPEKYSWRAIGVAGDELTLEQGKAVFKEAIGSDMPETFGFVGTGLKWAIKELGLMFEWFKTDGYGVDVKGLREELPQLQDFKTWLREDSGFKKQ